MNLFIEKAKLTDLNELENLYNMVNDYLESNINYPGWKKGVYPIRQHALEGINSNSLFVARVEGKIVGTIILNHKAEKAYHNVRWSFESDYSDVFVVHTFLIHPEFLNRGIGKQLLNYAEEYGKNLKIKALRLDVYENNMPAIKLYKNCGFNYIGTVDLGLGEYGLNWFELYEKLI
jgi:GNAT superfamily N-acetyltransferase